MLTDHVFTIPQSDMSIFFLNLDKEPAFDKKGNPWIWTGVGFFQGFHRGELRMGI